MIDLSKHYFLKNRSLRTLVYFYLYRKFRNTFVQFLKYIYMNSFSCLLKYLVATVPSTSQNNSNEIPRRQRTSLNISFKITFGFFFCYLLWKILPVLKTIAKKYKTKLTCWFFCSHLTHKKQQNCWFYFFDE